MRRSKLPADKSAIGAKLMDSGTLRHIDKACTVNCYSCGNKQPRSQRLAPPFSDKSAVRTELLDSVVIRICHIDIPVFVNGYI